MPGTKLLYGRHFFYNKKPKIAWIAWTIPRLFNTAVSRRLLLLLLHW